MSDVMTITSRDAAQLEHDKEGKLVKKDGKEVTNRNRQEPTGSETPTGTDNTTGAPAADGPQPDENTQSAIRNPHSKKGVK
ncbi:MAG: hypothetical protein OEW15_18920 [Nitrospirota bacterium]|nr:hypothetical protein [Nitrospirota bacterium]